MSGVLITTIVLLGLVFIVIVKTAVVVPQQSVYIVERLGKFSGRLDAGFHVLVPFVDVIRYRLSLKEAALDIPEQICITRDNVQVGVRVKSEWLKAEEEIWIELEASAQSPVVQLKAIRAEDDQVLCTAQMATGQQAGFAADCYAR